MRSKKKEKKIYIYKLIVTIIFALAIVFVLNTAQNYIRNEITGKTNLVINNGNVTKSTKNDVIIEDDVVYLSTKDVANFFDDHIFYDNTYNQIITTSEEIGKIDNVAKIQSRDETINGLVTIANGVRIVSAVILTLLILISIFIIANTIKLTVHARRKEISIMKYVGATDSFIRWPFVIEGIIIGIVAALISILILGVAYNLITNAMSGSNMLNRMGLKLLGFSDMTTLLVIVYMTLGIGIGALGSSISMRKYLQV